ncbi:hypothetical protein ACTWJ8_07420 [Streptomyces sp. SDT5-1]|uniref:hypothetical protein n=1 Tax=Streptomyces sp. SDT5-1 TaxID=3406418 RepID=UPI003FD41816
MTTSTPGLRAPAPPRPASSGRADWARFGGSCLRILSVLLVLDVLLQAALAGLFVTGDVSLLAWHAANAQVVGLLAVLVCGAAVLVWRAGRRSGWPALLGAVLVAAVLLQHGLGESRELGGHLPLGMTVFGLATVLAYWACALPAAGHEEVGP